VQPGPWVWVPVLAVVLLFAWCLLRLAAKAMTTENWRVRIAPDGVWINLRSYLNREFAPARTVCFVTYVEIESVCKHSIRRVESNGSRTTFWTDQYLEIQLREPVLPEMATEIAEERRRYAEGVHLGGLVTSRGRHLHVPVTVTGEDRLRIHWRGRQDFVVPGLKRVLRELAAECTVLKPTYEGTQNLNTMSAAEVDQAILDRVESGDVLGATKLLRDKRGYSLKEAKEFVDELTLRV
jgi:hypothetical protein